MRNYVDRITLYHIKDKWHEYLNNDVLTCIILRMGCNIHGKNVFVFMYPSKIYIWLHMHMKTSFVSDKNTTYPCILLHAYIHECMHACRQACWHACMQTYKHTDIHTHTYTHAYTHAYTHIYTHMKSWKTGARYPHTDFGPISGTHLMVILYIQVIMMRVSV